MAIKSLLISFSLTCCLVYTFTYGVTAPNSFLNKFPSWSFLPILLSSGLLYLMAFWWAIRGFVEHRLASLTSLLFCLIGFGVYAMVISSQLGKGKASNGQYEFDFNHLSYEEKHALSEVLMQTGLTLNDAVFTEHWHLSEPCKTFRICVQKGHITGLNLSGHSLQGLQSLNQLQHLTDLYLQNCQLNDSSRLRSQRLDRLDVSNNHITDLGTFKNCTNLRWLKAINNPLISRDFGQLFPKMVAFQATTSPKVK